MIKTTKEIFDTFTIRCAREGKYINDDSVTFSQEQWVSLDELKEAWLKVKPHLINIRDNDGKWISDNIDKFFPSPLRSTHASESKPEVDTKRKLPKEGRAEVNRLKLRVGAVGEPTKASALSKDYSGKGDYFTKEEVNELKRRRASALPKHNPDVLCCCPDCSRERKKRKVKL